MLTLIRPYFNYLAIGMVTILVIGILSYRQSLLNTIDDLEADIDDKEEFILKQEDKINLAKTNIALLEAQNNSLVNAIDYSNKQLEEIKIKNDKDSKELEIWKKKVATDGYLYRKEIDRLNGAIDNNKLKLGDCAEGLRLNKSISELAYDKI